MSGFLRITVILLLTTYTVLAQSTMDSIAAIYQQVLVAPIDSISKYKNKATAAHGNGNMEEFKEYGQILLHIAKANELTEEHISALMFLAIYHQQKDQYTESLSLYLEAEKLSESLPESSSTKLIVQVNLGNLYNHIEDYEKTKSSMKKVIALAKKQENHENIIVSAYNSLGTANLNQGNYAEALTYMFKVKEYVEKFKANDKIAATLINIAECQRHIGDYNQAIGNAQKALDKINTEESIELEASANVIIGICNYLSDEPAKALPYLKKAVDLAGKGSFLNIKMDAYEYLAKTHEALGQIKSSLVAQKTYIETREHYLKTLSKAQRLKVEKESEAKSSIITEQEESIAFLSKEKQVYVLVGLMLLVLLILSSVRYNNRRSRLLQESLQLSGDKALLKDENQALKHKLEILAHEIRSKENVSINSKMNQSKKSSFSAEEEQKYMTSILNYMEKEKPYLDHEINQSDMAKNLHMSVHLFSEVLNICFKKNFNNFINLYRVDTAKRLMRDPKFAYYKILAIGYEAGFPSKTSFNRVFKNLVGLTPTEYQKAQNLESVH